MGILRYWANFLVLGFWAAVGLFGQQNGYFYSENILFRLSADTVVTGGTLLWAAYLLVGAILIVLSLKRMVLDALQMAR